MCLLHQDDEAEESLPAEDEEAADKIERKQSFSTEEYDDDGLEDLPLSMCRPRPRGLVSRMASQTSVYLQEWDIPYEQLQLGELIGKVR